MSPRRDLSLADSISKKLSELRNEKFPGRGGQKKCAEKFGVKATTWSQWEIGVRTPSDEYQRTLADFFGVSIGELRGEASPIHERASLGQSEATVTDEEWRPLLDATATIHRALQQGLIDVAQAKVSVTDMAKCLDDILATIKAQRKKSGVRELDRMTG